MCQRQCVKKNFPSKHTSQKLIPGVTKPESWSTELNLPGWMVVEIERSMGEADTQGCVWLLKQYVYKLLSLTVL